MLCWGCSTPPAEGYSIVDGVIVFDVPARAEGQHSVLRLTVDPIPVVRVGFIGLGMRGPGAVERFANIDGVEIVALCDLYPERVDKSQEILAGHNLPAAAPYSGEEGWKELCRRDDIDLVYICTPWQLHVPMAVYAMEHGKHVAVEVPAAMSLDECWQLVDTAEKTQRHCMMLENCVYDFFELTTLNMAQHGLFGEILHTEGSYIHNLEPYWDYYQGNWRLDFNQSHRGDVYATHGLGPACQLLDIHRGDKMNYLVAMDTKSVNGLKLAKEKMGAETFANADQTLTLIKTERGRTILLEHNVYTPRPYSRMYQLTAPGLRQQIPCRGLCVPSRANRRRGDSRPRESERAFVHPPGGEGGADGALQASDRPGHRGEGPPRGRPRRHGFHHGLSPRLLPAAWPADRSGRLRRCRVVVHRVADLLRSNTTACRSPCPTSRAATGTRWTGSAMPWRSKNRFDIPKAGHFVRLFSLITAPLQSVS